MVAYNTSCQIAALCVLARLITLPRILRCRLQRVNSEHLQLADRPAKQVLSKQIINLTLRLDGRHEAKYAGARFCLAFAGHRGGQAAAPPRSAYLGPLG